jgi:hypothetical protein
MGQASASGAPVFGRRQSVHHFKRNQRAPGVGGRELRQISRMKSGTRTMLDMVASLGDDDYGAGYIIEPTSQRKRN